MHFRLGKIVFAGDGIWLVEEERTEENKSIDDDDLTYIFDPVNVVFVPDEEHIEEGDIVWFSLTRPCGGKDTIDTIKKPFFVGD